MRIWADSPHRRYRRRVLALAAACGVIAVGCGGNGADSTSSSAVETTLDAVASSPDQTVVTNPVPSPPATASATTATASSSPTPIASTMPGSPGDAPTSTEAGPDSNPTVIGDHEVGVATIVLDDPERPLTVEVWFPLAGGADPTTLTPQRYSLLPTVYLDSEVSFAADPTMMAPDARFPLIVFSHGSGGLRYINSRYTEALASHGYVVVSADHTGNTAVDTLAGTEPSPSRFADRVSDVRRLVDAFSSPPADSPAAPYAAAIDAEHVAVIGHSLGGWTALAAAVGSDDPPAATEPDDRIDAIVPIAPAVTGLLSPERLATLTQPMLILVGSDDVTTPPSPHVDDLWSATSDRPAYRVELIGAEHQSFTDVCVLQTKLASVPDVPPVVIDAVNAYAVEGCQPGDMPAARANEIAVTYTVEFLDQVFNGSAPISDVAPSDVTLQRR